jgi:hypothetical protein
LAKARKFFIEAKKFSAKFNVFRLKRFMLEPGRDVNASLQVKKASMHKLLALGPDLQNRDYVKLFNSLASILF